MAVRLLFDENLSERLIAAVRSHFPESLHVRLLGLGGATDIQLWERAAAERCVLVSKDEDFVRLSVFRGPPPKVVWLDVGNASTAAIAALLTHQAAAIESFAEHPESGFLALGIA